MDSQEEKIRKDKILDEQYKMWYRHRENLEKTRLKSADDFDKYLLTFSTGSLILSINFTNSLSGLLINDSLLIIGWTFLIASILTTLISFNLSEAAYMEETKRVDYQIECLNNEREAVSFDESFLSKSINVMNWFSLAVFIFGIVFLTLFYFLNIIK